MRTMMQFSTALIGHFRKLTAIALMTLLVLGMLSLIPSVAQAATTEILVGPSQEKFTFEPATVTIKAGDTIKWVNNLAADSACNVVFNQVKFATYPAADEEPDTDQELLDHLSHRSLLEAKETVKKIFNVPEGEYTYTCTPYQKQGMIGKIIVAEG